MDNRDILLVILVLAFMYNTYKLNNLENKENFTTATTQDQINTAVKRIYLADVEAIRLLSNFAIQLSQGGTTVPGNVTFSGKIENNATSNIYPAHWSPNEGIATNRIAVSDTVGAMLDNKAYGAYISTYENGSVYAKSKISTGGTIEADNGIICGKTDLLPNGKTALLPNGNVYADNGISFGPPSFGSITKGTGDGASASTYNLSINSWQGIGFKNDIDQKVNIWFDVRTGAINCKSLNIVP